MSMSTALPGNVSLSELPDDVEVSEQSNHSVIDGVDIRVGVAYMQGNEINTLRGSIHRIVEHDNGAQYLAFETDDGREMAIKSSTKYYSGYIADETGFVGELFEMGTPGPVRPAGSPE